MSGPLLSPDEALSFLRAGHEVRDDGELAAVADSLVSAVQEAHQEAIRSSLKAPGQWRLASTRKPLLGHGPRPSHLPFLLTEDVTQRNRFWCSALATLALLFLCLLPASYLGAFAVHRSMLFDEAGFWIPMGVTLWCSFVGALIAGAVAAR